MDNMSRPFSTLRFLRYFVLVVSGVLFVLVASVRIQQWVLRHRAERLLAEIQQIELRKTSFEDVRTLFDRWRKWGHYEGECERHRCLFRVTFGDFWYRHASLWKKSHLKVLYAALGGRPSEVHAGIDVMDGVVWEKWFGFGTSNARGFIQADAEAATTSWLPAEDERFALHPDYRVDTNLPYCEAVAVQFTPYEDPAEVRRLMEFNLSSLTHWGFRPEKSDVMPAACNQARKEAHLIPDVHNKPPAYELPRHESLEYLARDALRVAVVAILDKHSESAQAWRFKARVEVPLKRYSQQDAAAPKEIRLQCQDASSVPDVTVGGRYLIFTNDPDSILIMCGGMVPATEENLAITRQGMAQDYEAVFQQPNIGPR